MIVRRTRKGMTRVLAAALALLVTLPAAIHAVHARRPSRSPALANDKRFNPGLDPPYDERAEGLRVCLLQRNVDIVDSTRNDTHTYFDAAQGDNVRFHWHPVAIAYPRTTAQTSEVVKCAKQNGNTQTVARSGGHAFSGYSSGGQDGALIVDFREMASITPDSANALVHIQPGARLGDVAKALWNDGKRATPHGTCPTVGVGGHSLCGGVGPMSRKWGMSADNLVEAEVVLADGSVVTASEQQNADLWWAIRGAGSYYGLVTKFTLSTYRVDYPVTSINYGWSSSLSKPEILSSIMHAVQAFALHHNLPAEMGFHMMLNAGDRNAGEKIALHLRGLYLGAAGSLQRDIAPSLWKELDKAGAPKPDKVQEQEMEYLDFLKQWDDFGAEGDKLNTVVERKKRNNFVQRTLLTSGQKELSQRALRKAIDAYWQHAKGDRDGKPAQQSLSAQEEGGVEDHFWAWTVFFELFGGPNNRLRDEHLTKSSAMAHRDGLWLIQASVGTTYDRPLVHEAYALLHRNDAALYQALKDDGVEHMGYSCYADATLDDWKAMYYGKSIDRMVDLKKRYDPTNLFRSPQSLIETPAQPAAPGTAQGDGSGTWLGSPHPLP